MAFQRKIGSVKGYLDNPTRAEAERQLYFIGHNTRLKDASTCCRKHCEVYTLHRAQVRHVNNCLQDILRSFRAIRDKFISRRNGSQHADDIFIALQNFSGTKINFCLNCEASRSGMMI